MIKNNFRILKKQYAYLQTILKTPVKFQKDWPKTVGGVADTRIVVGADGRTDGWTDRWTDGRTDTQNFGGYNIIPRHFLVAGHKNCYKGMPTEKLIFYPTNPYKLRIFRTSLKIGSLATRQNVRLIAISPYMTINESYFSILWIILCYNIK